MAVSLEDQLRQLCKSIKGNINGGDGHLKIISIHLDSLLYMNSLDSLLYMNPALLAHAHIRFLIGIFILHKTRQRFWLS